MTFEPLILEHSDYYVYKDFSSFDVSVPLVVHQRAMDVGGVRRSFFTTLLNELKKPIQPLVCLREVLMPFSQLVITKP